MQVFIFAAGRGERMKPLSNTTPKPLLEINSKPLIGHILEQIISIAEVDKIIINCHYLAEQIIKYCNNFAQQHIIQSKIIISQEVEKLETGGGLLFAKNLIDCTRPLITINGDIIFHNNNDILNIYHRFIEYKKQNIDCDILLGLQDKSKFFGYDGDGDFNLKENGLIIKENINNYAFVGLQVINISKISDLAPRNTNNKVLTEFSMSYFYKEFIKQQSKPEQIQENKKINIRGHQLQQQYYHIGTVQNLEDCRKNIQTQ